MSKSGGCLCGAVTYSVHDDPTETGACHCSMCRKWSGGVYLGIEVPSNGLTLQGAENLTTFTSSEWAERAFCKTCGSNLYYRITAPGPHNGTYHIGFGTLNAPDGVALTGEVFIDEKPSGYSFAEKTVQMTGAELMALFAPPES